MVLSGVVVVGIELFAVCVYLSIAAGYFYRQRRYKQPVIQARNSGSMGDCIICSFYNIAEESSEKSYDSGRLT